jgi:hypothetical protein
VYAEAGLAGLLELAGRVERPGHLGAALGRSELLEDAEDAVLGEHLAAVQPAWTFFARGFVVGRVADRGRSWAEAKLADVAKVWSPEKRAEFLVCLPEDGSTWDLVEAAGVETEREYWRRVTPYGIRDPGDLERAARKLLEYGRPYTAVDLLASNLIPRGVLPPVLIAEALERACQTPTQEDQPLDSFAYHVSELLDGLEASGEIPEDRLARLEWVFLPLLGGHGRTPRVLPRALARDPNLFAEIVGLVYRAAGDEPREVSPEEAARAQRGHDLLRSWRTVPGTADDGTTDSNALKAWVRQAREALAATGRAAIGDEKIGKMLSGSPPGADGAWPHPAVCEVIEEAASLELERGIEVGVYHSRGVVTKGLREGGAQERRLAERYRGFAATIGDRWPRTAAVLGGSPKAMTPRREGSTRWQSCGKISAAEAPATVQAWLRTLRFGGMVVTYKGLPRRPDEAEGRYKPNPGYSSPPPS